MSINWKTINKWVYKTIIPVAIGVVLVILTIKYKGDITTLIASIASFATPLLALIDKLVKQIESAATDASTVVADAKQTVEDIEAKDVAAVEADVKKDTSDIEALFGDAKASEDDLDAIITELDTMGKGDTSAATTEAK